MLRTFYFIKPLIPRILQIALRRRGARRTLLLSKDVWPIQPSSEKLPERWQGWPENKRFSLVLVHDVEKKLGYDKCNDLLKMEQSLGFKASFNFVPERYKIQIKFIQRLKEFGFEVGVHGLKHDGKLFLSKRIYQQRAIKINQYISDWGAEGFYSPSMHRDLSRIHALEIRYDQSTFDTDPFEPQPSSVSRIYPFTVCVDGSNTGYIELPYTLPQDHTLFVILKEKGIEIWKKKLDWIVEKGGMALIKTHPDYMAFDNKPRFEQYPASLYFELLEYIKKQYQGLYWHALPREVAEFWKKEGYQ